MSAQVEGFVKSLAPQPRRALTRAIKGLRYSVRGCKRLEADLTGYHRLRVMHYRVIFAEAFEGNDRVIECVYAAPRSRVYELFAELLKEQLR